MPEQPNEQPPVLWTWWNIDSGEYLRDSMSTISVFTQEQKERGLGPDSLLREDYVWVRLTPEIEHGK